jgi:hypothetical protein
MSVSVATSEDFKVFVKEATSISKEWKVAFNDEVTVVETKKYKDSSLNSVRVSSIIEGVSPMKLIGIIYDPQYEELFTKVAEDEQVLETIDENNIVHYCKLNFRFNVVLGAMKSPFLLVSHRDFVTRRSMRKTEEECIVMFNSVEHESMPVRSNHIRGFTWLNGYHMIQTENGTRLTYVTRGDLGGYFPSWCINYIATSLAPGVITNLKDVVQQVIASEKK